MLQAHTKKIGRGWDISWEVQCFEFEANENDIIKK